MVSIIPGVRDMSGTRGSGCGRTCTGNEGRAHRLCECSRRSRGCLGLEWRRRLEWVMPQLGFDRGHDSWAEWVVQEKRQLGQWMEEVVT